MDDEFKLCWKNFQDNIASGFQNLYDRGDLVDVTLACDGKLLQAHKIVLAICSPYFQEIFTTNPCKHPIIILKDVSFNIMLELLEFMYQGVVNVKHTELQSFMKIGQLLQIKGLATNPSSSAASTSSEKSSHLPAIEDEHPQHSKHTTAKASTTGGNANDSNPLEGNASSAKVANTAGGSLSPARSRSQCPSPVPAPPPAPSSAANSPSPTPMSYVLNQHSLKSSPAGDVAGNVTPLLNLYHSSGAGSSGGGGASSSNAGGNLKRHLDAFSNDALSIYSRKQFRRSLPLSEHNSSLSGDQQDHNTSDSNGGGPGGSAMGPLGDQVNHEDFFLPHISMVESRYDLNNLKREADHHSPVVAAAAAAAALRTFGPAFNFEYNPYKGSSTSAAAGGNGGVGGGGLSGNGGGGPANNTGQEYPNELHMPNDYSKNFGNHMDIPQNSGNNVMMLSSTSLLHGNCVFNRNNTVATQQGMKTYWLCKSYRISMCRARCITHQGRVISATGVHNHAPHMRPGAGNGPAGGGPPTGVSHLATASATNASGQTATSIVSIAPHGNSGSFVIESPSGHAASSMANGAGASGHLQNSLNPNVGVGAMAGSRLCQGPTGSLSQMYHHQHGGANSHAHHQQQPPTPGHHQQGHHQQSHHDHSTIAPPSPSALAHSLPNLLIQHPQAASPSDLNMHGQHHHGGGMASSMHSHTHHHMAMMASAHDQHQHSHQAGDPQHSPHLSHHHQQPQHQGHHSQHQAQLEITPLMQSSPANGGAVHDTLSPPQNSTRHGGSNSHTSPVGGAGATAASDSPQSMNEDNNNCSLSEHQILVHNAALDDDLSSPEMTASGAELSGDGGDQHQQHPHQHHQQQQAQVIDSITISPGSGHDFKMEDM